MDEDNLRSTVIDAMSDFYNDVMKSRFDGIDQSIKGINHEISDLRLTSEALVKIVDYAKLEAKVIDLEGRLRRLERNS